MKINLNLRFTRSSPDADDMEKIQTEMGIKKCPSMIQVFPNSLVFCIALLSSALSLYSYHQRA